MGVRPPLGGHVPQRARVDDGLKPYVSAQRGSNEHQSSSEGSDESGGTGGGSRMSTENRKDRLRETAAGTAKANR